MSHRLPRRLCSATLPARVVKGVTQSDGNLYSPPAVLCYPGADLQGDIVEPAGGDWRPFRESGRLVNYEHGPYVGTGFVALKSIPVGNGERADVPVGVTKFFTKSEDLAGLVLKKYDRAGNVVGLYDRDECLRTAEQVAPLVLDGTLNGVSIEFCPNGPEGVSYKSLGPSPNLSRNACHFLTWKGLGWAAACHAPVNPNARYVIDDRTRERAEKALRVCESPTTLEFVRKSLTPLASLARTPGRVSAAVGSLPVTKTTKRVRKADEYDDDLPGVGVMDDTADTMNPEDPAPEPMGDDDTPPTAAAAYQMSQTLMDACAIIKDMLNKSEHVKGKKKLDDLCGQVESLAAKAAAIGEMVEADLGGSESDADYDDTAEPEPLETDEEGAIVGKSFRKSLKLRRVKLGDLQPARRAKAKPKADDSDLQFLLSEVKRLKRLAGE